MNVTWETSDLQEYRSTFNDKSTATEVTCLVDKLLYRTIRPCQSSCLGLQYELLWLIELLLHFLSLQAEDNADIGGTIEDEDEGSDDPNLEVRNLLWT